MDQTHSKEELPTIRRHAENRMFWKKRRVKLKQGKRYGQLTTLGDGEQTVKSKDQAVGRTLNNNNNRDNEACYSKFIAADLQNKLLSRQCKRIKFMTIQYYTALRARGYTLYWINTS